MTKMTFFLIFMFICLCPFHSIAISGEIKLVIKDFECLEDGKMKVHYGLVSDYDFDYPNVTLGFKVTDGKKTVACSEIKATVPKDSDGSKIEEIIIDSPCSGKSYDLKSAVFYYVKRYRIDEWFSDCK
jgi:hypothetical protein